ncbi:MAG: DUF4190 domain-containing protein [Verrucomicrobiae bacterium]|nr:DUF4190 domain-containing protein [Verrucomicrobiae bacterium]MCP5539100.1 DUF4190 domain-containing protein [Akkermansiaceae bacterium]
MVLGILNAMLLCAPGILLGPAAIVCGHLALARAKHSEIQPVPGRGMAVIGTVLGYLGMVFFILGLLAWRFYNRFLQEGPVTPGG